MRDFVDAEQFSKLLSERGISNDDTVVLYGGNNNWFAAYAYWYFKLYGHDKVKLLDGGRKKWELDGRPLSTEAVNRPATTYTAQAPDNAIRAFRDEVIAVIGARTSSTSAPPTSSPEDPGARAPSAGAEPAPGHIPVRSTFRGVRRPTRTARSSPTRTWQAVRRGRPGRLEGDHRVLPDR